MVQGEQLTHTASLTLYATMAAQSTAWVVFSVDGRRCKRQVLSPLEAFLPANVLYTIVETSIFFFNRKVRMCVSQIIVSSQL